MTLGLIILAAVVFAAILVDMRRMTLRTRRARWELRRARLDAQRRQRDDLLYGDSLAMVRVLRRGELITIENRNLSQAWSNRPTTLYSVRVPDDTA